MKAVSLLFAFVLLINVIGCGSYKLTRLHELNVTKTKKELSSENAPPKFDTPQSVSEEDRTEILKYLIPDESKSESTINESEPESTPES
ncbi:MAG: hypothetical protein ACE5NG_00260 [bacterium]